MNEGGITLPISLAKQIARLRAITSEEQLRIMSVVDYF
jgi:hypothetical protein